MIPLLPSLDSSSCQWNQKCYDCSQFTFLTFHVCLLTELWGFCQSSSLPRSTLLALRGTHSSTLPSAALYCGTAHVSLLPAAAMPSFLEARDYFTVLCVPSAFILVSKIDIAHMNETVNVHASFTECSVAGTAFQGLATGGQRVTLFWYCAEGAKSCFSWGMETQYHHSLFAECLSMLAPSRHEQSRQKVLPSTFRYLFIQGKLNFITSPPPTHTHALTYTLV
jgi:hypothetical protein